jgi:hypothetical protein
VAEVIGDEPPPEPHALIAIGAHIAIIVTRPRARLLTICEATHVAHRLHNPRTDGDDYLLVASPAYPPERQLRSTTPGMGVSPAYLPRNAGPLVELLTSEDAD